MRVSICANCMWCGDRYNFPRPETKLDVDKNNPYLKVYYCCSSDAGRYGKRIDNKNIQSCNWFTPI